MRRALKEQNAETKKWLTTLVERIKALDASFAALLEMAGVAEGPCETKRWAAALQAEYERLPALREELERAARAR